MGLVAIHGVVELGARTFVWVDQDGGVAADQFICSDRPRAPHTTGPCVLALPADSRWFSGVRIMAWTWIGDSVARGPVPMWGVMFLPIGQR